MESQNLDFDACGELYKRLPDEIIVHENFIRFCGDWFDGGEVVEAMVADDHPDVARDLKLIRLCVKITGVNDVPVILCPAGFPREGIPGYDLVLRKRGTPNIAEVVEPGFVARCHESEDRAESFRSALADFVAVPCFINISGSFVYHDPGREPNDVDVIVKKFRPDGMIQRILEVEIGKATGLPVHVVWEPRGPNWASMPLYDLVLKPSTSDEAMQEAEEPALKVPDPAFIVWKLKAGHEAILLSGDDRSGVSGRTWLLLNERIKEGEPTLAWGRVKFTQETATIPNLSALGPRQTSLDDISRREFAQRKGPFFILRLSLVDAFDTPRELKSETQGRRYTSRAETESHSISESDGVHPGEFFHPQKQSISCLVIGRRKQPASWTLMGMKEPMKPLVGEDAIAAFKELTRSEKTFIFNCAILDDDGNSVAINARGKYAPSDVALRWIPSGAVDPVTKEKNAGPGEWRGTDDPKIWDMAKGWPAPETGVVLYGKTFATRLEPTPKPGEDLVEVQVGEFQEWVDDAGAVRWSWTFPSPVETVLERRPPDSIDAIRKTTRFITEVKEGRMSCPTE